jgi:molybdopterin molybdotransferase
MISFDEALDTILSATPVLAETVASLAKARGRLLLRDLVATMPLPQFATSSVDGFAVCAPDLLAARSGRMIELTLAGEATAGNPLDGRLASGQAVYVATGARVPEGADAVVKREDVDLNKAGLAIFSQSVEEGSFIRSAGSDVAGGERILPAGSIVRPAEVGLLASFGLGEVSVHRRPRVNILATGDELVDLGEDLPEGRIFSSTSHLLAALVKQEGGRARICGIVPDKRKKLRKRISDHLDCDILVITGGTSKGRHDFLDEVLKDLDVDLRVRGVRIRPGRPMMFGVREETLVFGLPGSPLSTFATFLMCVRPALRKMAGFSQPSKSFTARLSGPYARSDDRRHFVPGVLTLHDGVFHAHPVSGGEAKPFSTMVRTNCLIVVPEERREVKTGDLVAVEPFSSTIDRSPFTIDH